MVLKYVGAGVAGAALALIFVGVADINIEPPTDEKILARSCGFMEERFNHYIDGGAEAQVMTVYQKSVDGNSAELGRCTVSLVYGDQSNVVGSFNEASFFAPDGQSRATQETFLKNIVMGMSKEDLYKGAGNDVKRAFGEFLRIYPNYR